MLAWAMDPRRVYFISALGMLAVVSACHAPRVFRCSTSSQCGTDGYCELTGYCSFPDSACSEQRRYDEYAGEGYSDVCVSEPPMTEPVAHATGGPGDPSSPPGSSDPRDEAIVEMDSTSTHEPGSTSDLAEGSSGDGSGIGAFANCADELRNGDETDVDCGGSDPTCARCVDGQSCELPIDCASANCSSESCTSACDDSIANGDETGIDCGGSCEPCAPGDACRLDSDCSSGACQSGLCCGGTTQDCTRCAERLSPQVNCVDADSPADRENCSFFLQCMAEAPDLCPTRLADGCSGTGDVCDVVVFGGNSGGGMVQADRILGNANCTF